MIGPLPSTHPAVTVPPDVMFAGHVIAGGCVSLTVTVNMQVAFGLSGDVSIAVQVTVVVPTAKNVPDAGVHVVVTPGQLSEAIGAG